MTTHTGGCQCGAIRFRAIGDLKDSSICHCRMCQKAFGNFFAPLVSVPLAQLVWTKKEPQRFQSSNHARRGFCPDCGTPLSYEAPDGMALAIGAFDDPEEIAPQVQWGLEGKLPYVDTLTKLPGHDTMSDPDAVEFLKSLVSFQHPDHETDAFPPEQGGTDS